MSRRHLSLATASARRRLALIAPLVLAWTASARADDDRAPITVVVAETADRPHHEALIGLADAIARDRGIDRAAQARTWRERTTDGAEVATPDQLAAAADTVAQTCQSIGVGATLEAGRDATLVREAADVLAHAAGVSPGSARIGAAWSWYERMAWRAAQCLGTLRGPTRTARLVPVVVAPGRDLTPMIYVDGRAVLGRWHDGLIEFELPADHDALVHLRCGDARCSPLLRVPAGRDADTPLPLVDLTLVGRVDDALALTYATDVERNDRVARDAAAVTAVSGARASRGGPSLVLADEGPDVRLLLVDRDGAPLATQRAAWADAAATADRLIAGDTAPAIGAPAAGLYTVLLREVPGAPRLERGATRFDAQPSDLRRFCADRTCRFGAPAGRVTLTLRRTGLVDDVMTRSIVLDGDLDITVVPGRRYAAKYVGRSMMIVGGGTALATALIGGLMNKLGQSACGAAMSGPDDCDQRSFTGDGFAEVFFAGVGTAAVGAVLNFVVHKAPRLRVRHLHPR